MFQRAVVTPAIGIANKFGDVAPTVAIGTGFVRVYAPMAAILVHHSMVLMGHTAAWPFGAATQTRAGTFAESALVRRSSETTDL